MQRLVRQALRQRVLDGRREAQLRRAERHSLKAVSIVTKAFPPALKDLEVSTKTRKRTALPFAILTGVSYTETKLSWDAARAAAGVATLRSPPAVLLSLRATPEMMSSRPANSSCLRSPDRSTVRQPLPLVLPLRHPGSQQECEREARGDVAFHRNPPVRNSAGPACSWSACSALIRQRDDGRPRTPRPRKRR